MAFDEQPKSDIDFDTERTLELTSNIIAAYVANNPVVAGELPGLIKDVHKTLTELGSASERLAGPLPAVPVSKSITDDHLICLEDGKKFKSLKRHLRARYNLSPDEYRQKWGLPVDYPMVAPSYARKRSRLAKEMGLGQ